MATFCMISSVSVCGSILISCKAFIVTLMEVTFVETDTEEIKTALVQGYEAITGRKLYPADPMRLFILWVADIPAKRLL